MDKYNKTYSSFLIGSIGAVVGGLVTHPIDLMKVRMQLESKKNIKNTNLMNIGFNIIKNEGYQGLIKGYDACICRQFIYSGTRFGIYDILKNNLVDDKGILSISSKILCAGIAGSIGSFIANPIDLVLVRMQSGRNKPLERKYNFGFINTFINISKI